MMLKYNLILISFFFCGCGFFPPLRSSSNSVNLDPVDIQPVGVPQEESFVSDSKKNKKLDILFVVDTSYSMVKHLREVNETFKGFINNLSPISWKIAFTNADYDPNVFSYYSRDLFLGKAMRLELNGSILPQKFLYPYFTDKEQIFLNTLKKYEQTDIEALDEYINPCDLPPYCQGSIRNPIQSLIHSFSVNKDFFRKSADFAAIIFTNGNDMYNEDNIINKYVSEFHKHQGSNKKMTLYSISIIPGDQKCLEYNQSFQYNFSTSVYSETIHELVKATGGETMSICSANYSHLASVIAKPFISDGQYY